MSQVDGLTDRHLAVDVQGKCPVNCPPEMSFVYPAMGSDSEANEVVGDRRVGGLSASMNFLMVSRWRPNSFAIRRMDRPCSLAFWIASHRACCKNVGLLGDAVTLMEITSSSSTTERGPSPAASIASGFGNLSRGLAPSSASTYGMELTQRAERASFTKSSWRCLPSFVEGGTSERDLRDERSGPFHPGNRR